MGTTGVLLPGSGSGNSTSDRGRMGVCGPRRDLKSRVPPQVRRPGRHEGWEDSTRKIDETERMGFL